MKETTSNTEVRAVKATRKYTSKKLGNDMYEYRGWIIKKYDNNYLCDDEIRGFQWNTYQNLDGYNSSRTIDMASTLREAKMYIDNCFQHDPQVS